MSPKRELHAAKMRLRSSDRRYAKILRMRDHTPAAATRKSFAIKEFWDSILQDSRTIKRHGETPIETKSTRAVPVSHA